MRCLGEPVKGPILARLNRVLIAKARLLLRDVRANDLPLFDADVLKKRGFPPPLAASYLFFPDILSWRHGPLWSVGKAGRPRA
jgi:hypothetical protein